MPDNQQTSGEIHEDQLLNLPINSLDKGVALSPAENAELNAEDIYEVFVGTCADGTSVFTLCKGSRDTPRENSVLYHLHTKFDLETLEQIGNTLLQKGILNVPPQQMEVCVNLYLRSYYGDEDDTDGLYRSQAKRGTTAFHVYAVLYIRVKSKRYTLAVCCPEDGNAVSSVLTEFLGTLDGLNLGVKVIYLNHEFYDSKCLMLLRAHNHAYVIPIVRWGQTIRRKLSEGWNRVIQHSLATKLDDHSWITEFPVYVDCTYQNGRYDERGIARHGYAADASFIDSPRDARYHYVKRFGIETSYRLSKQSIATTSIQDPAVRLLYVVVSLLLQNVWRYSYWEYVTTPRRGRRHFWEWSFKEFINMIRQAAWTALAMRRAVPASRPPGDRFYRQLPAGLASGGSSDAVAPAVATADSNGSSPIRP